MTEPPPDSGITTTVAFRWAIRAIVVLPIFVAAVRAVTTGWFPVGDSALLAIRAHDVGTADHPLLGSWTSASLTLGTDVNNPGPLYPDLVAPFMWTFGRWFSIGTGIAVGVASVNAGFVLLTGWVGHRLGGWRVERWALLFVAALAWAMGSELLIDIWQPHALLLPFACFLLLTVGLIDGHWRMLPVWLAVASLIVQTHIGYVYVLTVLGLVVIGHGVVTVGNAGRSLGELFHDRTAQWSAGVVALAWVQPIVEQLYGEGRGNLLRLATNAGGGEVTIGAGTAVKLVARVVALPLWWTRFGFDDSVMSTPLTDTPNGPQLVVPGLPGGPLALVAVAVLAAALAGLTLPLRRAGASLAAAATLVAAIGVVTAVATLTIQTVSVVGLGSHHVRWLFVLSLFVQVAVAWAIVELGVARLVPRAVEIGVPVVIVLFVALNVGFYAHDLGPTADRAAIDTLERTFDDLDSFDPGGPVLYDVGGIRPFEPWSSAVQMGLVERDVEFRVDDEGVVRQLGNGRRADGSEVTTLRQIERGAALIYDGPGCVVSLSSTLDEMGEAEVDALIDAAVAALSSGDVVVDASGLGDDLPARFTRATNGDAVEARVLVADGLLPFMAGEDRIVESAPAVDAAVEQAALIDQRVVGTLLLIADPPVGC